MTGTLERVALTNVACWPDVRRGSEALLHGLAGWLGREGLDVTVVAGARRSRQYRIDDVVYSTVRAPDLTGSTRHLVPEVTMIPGMVRRLRRLRPDLAHSFLYHDAVAAQLAGIPSIVSYGGVALPSSFLGRPLERRLFQRASEHADAVVCPSRAAADHLRVAFGLRAEVVPNGLDVAAFAVEEQRLPGRILCAATPDDRRKRAEVLVDALAALRRRGVDAHVAFAGAAAGGRRRALTERLPEGERDRVVFLGELDQHALAHAYASAAVSCLPSLHEAFGMVVVESLAAGTPVVGTEHGAIPELLTPDVGSTFAPDAVDDLSDALEGWLDVAEDPAVRTACRRRAAKYDWSAIGPVLTDLYDRRA